MKKLVLILSAIVVLVAFAVPVFAMEMYDPEQRLAKLYDEKASVLKVSGEFTFGMITPVGDSDKADVGFANAYLDFTIWPDEYNSILVELGASKEFSAITGNEPDIIYWELTSDVGSYFGLPIGLKNTIGLSSLYTNKYEVTGHAWERTKIRSQIDPLAWKVFGDFGVVQATVAIGFGETTNAVPARPWTGSSPVIPAVTTPNEAQGAFNDFGIYLFVPDAARAEWEFWYMSQNNPDLKGALGISAKWDGLAGGLLGIAAGFVYDIRELQEGGAGQQYVTGTGFDYRTGNGVSATDKYWAWGAGVSIDYVGLAVGLSANGDFADAFDQLAIDVDYAFGDFGVYGTGAFTFVPSASRTTSGSFLGSEIGVYLKAGGAKWTLGYLFDGDDADGYAYSYSVAAVTYAQKGGIFIIGDIDF